MKPKSIVISLLLALSVFGCTSAPKSAGLSDTNYEKLIDTHTKSDKIYSGFHNIYQVQVTQLTTKVRTAIVERFENRLRWDSRTAKNEREKVFQEASSESEFFVSLFTPEREHNDLDKQSSMWKVFLEHNGQRYEGKVQKSNMKLVELKTIWPYHQRWSKPYKVKFAVPMSVIEDNNSKFIMTSTLGTTEFKF